MAKPEITAPPGRQEILVSSIYNAPRDLVFNTITDPILISQWWGPSRYTTAVHKMVAMPGGIWRFVQRDKEGHEYGFHGVYHDVVPPERLVYTMEYEGMPGHVSLHIETYTERDKITICAAQTIFQSLEDRDGMLRTGMEEGTSETTERLNQLLMRISKQTGKGEQMDMQMEHHDGKSIKITRVFNAPREEVWQRWTNPDDYMCWWGPKEYYAPTVNIDLRPGGKYLSSMRGPDGKDIWSTGIYKEIVEPNRLVMTDSFADEHGNIVPASYYNMGDNIPMEMEVELTLEDLGGKTRMTLEHCGLPEDLLEPTKQGWNESFDKLEACLQ